MNFRDLAMMACNDALTKTKGKRKEKREKGVAMKLMFYLISLPISKTLVDVPL